MPTYRVTLTETIVYTLDIDAPEEAVAAELALEGMQTDEHFAAHTTDSAGDLRVVDVDVNRDRHSKSSWRY